MYSNEFATNAVAQNGAVQLGLAQRFCNGGLCEPLALATGLEVVVVY
jgi:hypothetical protein